MEMISEIKRDLVEMGQPISTYSMQNKIIEWNKDYETKEITNYSFCLSDLDNIEDIMNYEEFIKAEQKRIDNYFWKDQIKLADYWEMMEEEYWYIFPEDPKNTTIEILKIRLKEDFKERISEDINPWKAWRIRPWVWEEFIEEDWEFDYTYSERIHYKDLMEDIKVHPTSRQYIFNIWDRDDRFWVNGKQRIPCSLNYQILIRPNWELDENNQPVQCVNLIYNMRSCDYLTHFPIDIIQATNLLKLITSEIWNNYQIGKLYYNCASLHLYRKDLIEDVF